MTDPYIPCRTSQADPGPTPSDLLVFFDGMSGAPALSWRGDWNRYAAWLFSVCLRRRVQVGDAQEAVQEVLAALGNFRRFRRTHPGSPLRPWLVGVLAHKLGDQQRDRARRPELIPAEHLDVLSGACPIDPEFTGTGDPGCDLHKLNSRSLNPLR